MKILRALLLGYISYEMWQTPAELWHKLAIVAGVLALIELIEFGKEKRNGNNSNK